MTEPSSLTPEQWRRSVESLDAVIQQIDAGELTASSSERTYLVAARQTLERLMGVGESGHDAH